MICFKTTGAVDIWLEIFQLTRRHAFHHCYALTLQAVE